MMKRLKSRRRGILIGSLLLFALAMPFSSVSSKALNPLANSSSYKIYYDYPTKKIIQRMQTFDFVIIEPTLYSKEQIEQIQTRGTKVYGYLNAMEADNWNQALISQLHESDFFHRNGKRVHYEEWDSYLTDISSPHYRQVMIGEFETQIADKGLDGAFLDTVGNIDDEHSDNPIVLKEQRDGMASFMKAIKELHSELSLIQNWGFGTLNNSTYPYVDGIMWENFQYAVISKDSWAQERIRDLQLLHQTTGIEVLTVSFSQKNKSMQYSKNKGFIHYHEGKDFNTW